MHIGSGTDLEHLSEVCGAMERAALAVGSSIKSISAGGGLPMPYREGQEYVDIAAYFKLWDATRHKLATQFGHEIALEIEPGRYLVAESGYLISEIRAIKTDGRQHVLPARCGLQQPGTADFVRVLSPDGDLPGRLVRAASGATKDVIVGGPLCESGDIFTQEEGGFVTSRLLPTANVGDFLVIGVCRGVQLCDG